MLTKLERAHRDIVVEVLKVARYTHCQAICIATHCVGKLRKGEENE